MKSRIIFFDSGKISSCATSTFRFCIFVIAFLNEPFVLRKDISSMLKSSGVRLWDFRISCSISPSLPFEKRVL